MQIIKAWVTPSHYYIYGKKARRSWTRVLLVVGTLLISVAYGLHSQLTTQAASASIQLSNKTVAAPQASALSGISEEAQTASTVKPSYTQLQTAIERWASQQKTGEWSVVVQDLHDQNNRAIYRAETSYSTASLYKLFMTIPLAQKLPFSKWQSQKTLDGQGNHNISECVQAMLSKSDNPCGEAVAGYVGWYRATSVLKRAGFSQTKLATTDLRSTPYDVALYMQGLYEGKWFDPQTRDFIMQSLGNQKFRAGIPKGCSDCTVLNKTGDLNGYLHDAAIVTNGQSEYVLVIMSKGGSYDQVANLSHLISTQLKY